jgi:glycosyltransferase involved in cell wall biosynthesis
MANAVPVVLPDHGSFSEMVADTGGGVLHRPHDPSDLADRIAELLSDADSARKHGAVGQEAIRDRYHDAAMARKTIELYRRLVPVAAAPLQTALAK